MTREEYANFLVPNVEHDYDFYLKKYPKRNLPDTAIVSRFAPSPTGFLHMGSLYTTFYAVQLSKQTGGVSFLRIEDTDQKRTIEDGTFRLINDFKNLGIEFDEDPIKGGKYAPYIQSEREDIYKAFVKKLIEEDKAYPCFLTKEEIDSIRASQESAKKRIGIYGKYARCRNLSMDECVKRVNDGKDYIIRLKSDGDFEKAEWI